MRAKFFETGFKRALTIGVLAAASVAGAGVSRAAPSSSYAQGIDVSEYQGSIDWAAVAGSGISFAIARVSDGLNYPDPYFAKNWSGMQANGVIRGVYQYFEPSQDAVAQADMLASSATFQSGDLPPFLDLEVSGGLSSSALNSQITIWVNEIEAKTGMTPIIYTYPAFWQGLGKMTVPAGVQLWIANWDVSAPTILSGWSDWTFWQWADTSSVSGVGGADSDVFNGTVAQLQAFAASHGSVAPSGAVSSASPTSSSSSSSSAGYPMLRDGSTGYCVEVLQTDLTSKGFSPGGVDGIFGPETRAAVESFQSYYGLSVDGIVGPITWGAVTQ